MAAPAEIVSSEQESTVIQQLEARWAEGKFLCVGLDVDVHDPTDPNPVDLYEKAKLIVDATRDIAAAYKPNSAFYEGEGHEGDKQLELLVHYIRDLAPDVPVLWDAKRADISKTNEGYSSAADKLGVQGITLHPYLGGSALSPLLSDPNRLGIVLGHTSNPGAAEFQHLRLQSGELLWERVVANVAHHQDWKHGSPLGIVTGATYPEELAKARFIAGDDVVMLIPGIGTQGGDLEASVRGAMNSRGNGFLINVSSGISKAKDASGHITNESVRDAAIKYHEQIKEVWAEEIAHPTPSYGDRMFLDYDSRLADVLYEQECIRFGDFVLKSGRPSPVFVDLRSTITDPDARDNIAQIYVDMVRGLEMDRGEPFDLIAGIPQAVTTYGAIVADRMRKRLVQPRSGVKDYGTGKTIEGRFQQGETVCLIDDLMTDGGAKFDTIAQIEAGGLTVGALAILLDREQGGMTRMAEAGHTVRSTTTLRRVINVLGDNGRISADHRDEVIAYLDAA